MQQLMKILADGRDQADAGVEAGDHEDRCEQHLAAPAEQAEREAGQRVRAGRAAGKGRAGQRARMGEHGINGEQQRSGDQTGGDRAASDLTFLINAARADVEGDDRAEVECGECVHRLIAVQNAAQRGQGLIFGRRGGVMRRDRMHETAAEQHEDENDERRAEHAPETVGQLFGMERDCERRGEENRRIEQLMTASAADERRKHLKRGARRARDCEAGSDGQVDQHREHEREARMHPRGECAQTPGARDRDDASNRQADRADREAGESRPGILSGLSA